MILRRAIGTESQFVLKDFLGFGWYAAYSFKEIVISIFNLEGHSSLAHLTDHFTVCVGVKRYQILPICISHAQCRCPIAAKLFFKYSIRGFLGLFLHFLSSLI